MPEKYSFHLDISARAEDFVLFMLVYYCLARYGFCTMRSTVTWCSSRGRLSREILKADSSLTGTDIAAAGIKIVNC